jgi:hypothetical protein
MPAEAAAQLCFWSKNGVDRYAFLARIIASLESSKTQVHLDTGWGKHDVEIIPNRWTRLVLTTVNEYLADEKIFHRCRLKGKWSVLAKILFGVAVVDELLLVSQFGGSHPWLWMLLLTLPLLAWFFDDELRHHKLATATVIKDTAAQLNLEAYQPAQPAESAPALHSVSQSVLAKG